METPMITLQDCIAFTELDEEALRHLVARHRLPDIIAAQHRASLGRAAQGCPDRPPKQAAPTRRASKRSALWRSQAGTAGP
jgi:hypothetical protein